MSCLRSPGCPPCCYVLPAVLWESLSSVAPQNPTPAAHLGTRDLGPLIWKVSSVLWAFDAMACPHCPEAPCVCAWVSPLYQATWGWDLNIPASISPLLWLPASTHLSQTCVIPGCVPSPQGKPQEVSKEDGPSRSCVVSDHFPASACGCPQVSCALLSQKELSLH